MPDQPDHIGKQFGNYRLHKFLGKGGFSEIYLGKHVHLDKLAAIKILHTFVEDGDFEQFREEARIIARLEHAHIIRILDFDVKENTPFIVMEYAQGGTLRKQHPRGTTVPLEIAVHYVKQIAAALQFAHDHNVIHCDVKPENMLLGNDNNIVLTDFGIAVISRDTTSQTTQDNVGTVSYMAPEQIRGKPRPASDQYALAVVIYEWLCGYRPFQGDNPYAIQYQHVNEPPPPLCASVTRRAPLVEEVILKALAKDPHKRYPSIQEFAAAFAQAASPPKLILPVQKIQHISSPPPKQEAIQPILPTPLPDNPKSEHKPPLPLKNQTPIKISQQVQPAPAITPLPLYLPDNLAPLPAVVQPIPIGQQNTRPLPAPIVDAIPAPRPQPEHSPIAVVRRNSPVPVAATPPIPAHNAPPNRPTIRPRRNRRSVFLAILLVLLLCGGIALAAPSTFSSLGNTLAHIIPGSPPSATISLTAATQTVKDTYVIAAVTGTPNSTQRQVQARQLTYTTPSQSKTAPTTGIKTIPATQATGTLTFYNGLGIAQQVSASTAFPVGVETIHITSSVTIPAAPPGGGDGIASVSAYAVPPGHFGNIVANAIDEYCCSNNNSIAVRNLAAFTGGVDQQQQFTVLQQSDIDNAANPLKTQLMQSALTSLKAQQRAGEQFVSQPQCKPNVSSDHNAGDQVSSVTVTATATCTGEVYDKQGAQILATDLLKTKAVTTLDSHYVQDSQISVTISQATIADPTTGTLSILVTANGLWVYQFTASDKANLVQLIKGKTAQTATTLLLQQPDVAKVDKLSLSSGSTLPTDPTQITFNILNVPTVQGTGTPDASGSPTTPRTTLYSSPSNQNGNG